MRKRIVTLLISLSMLFSLTLNTFAVETAETDIDENILRNVMDCDIYSYSSSEKTAVAIINTVTKETNISIIYKENSNSVYEWVIDDYNYSSYDPNKTSFWRDIVDFAETNMRDAKIKYVETTITNDEIQNNVQPRNAATMMLREDLTGLHGEEYYNKVVCTRGYNGQTFRITENMTYLASSIGSFSWTSAISVASILAGVGGMVTEGAVALICGWFSVGAGTLTSMVTSRGSITRYICTVSFMKYTSINGSAYPYCTTSKYYYYDGYDASEEDQDEGAELVTDSRYTTYSDSETFFNSCTQQTEQAYQVYEIVGQKP